MKRRRIGWIILITAVALQAQTMSVQVEKAALRKGTSFLSPVQGFLLYATSVKVIEHKGAWVRVAAGKRHGWVHESALFDGEIVRAAAQQQPGTEASADEIMLAGKGFNRELEAAYRSDNPTLRYDLVDAVQSQVTDAARLKAFAEAGELDAGAL